MPASPLDILIDALNAAEEARIPRKELAGGSKAQYDRLGRLLAGDVSAVDLGPAIELARNLPPDLQASLARAFFPALHVSTEIPTATPADLVDATADLNTAAASLNHTSIRVARDGKVDALERRQTSAKVAALRAAADRVDATLNAIPAPKPAHRRK